MAKKKFTNTQLVVGAVVALGVGYLIFRKPPKAVTAGNGNGNGTGTGGTEGSGSDDVWTYIVQPLTPGVWVATIIDSTGLSETLPPQGTMGAADAAARVAINQYGGTPQRIY
jgi:hypothetical protein